MMQYSRAFVFQEIKTDTQTYFQWFRLGLDDEDYIEPDQILSEWEHWERLESD